MKTSHIVPEVQPVRQLAPRSEVVAKGHGVVDVVGRRRVGKTVLDGCNRDNNVRTRANRLGRLLRVQVTPCADSHIGKLLADDIRHLIDEVDERGAVTVLLLVKCGAPGALAPATEPVVLTDGNDISAWRRTEALLHILRHDFDDLRLGQAELDGAAFAAREREVLGMLVEVLLRRQEVVEGVASLPHPCAAASFLQVQVAPSSHVAGLDALHACVQLVARGPVGVDVRQGDRAELYRWWGLAHLERADRDAFPLRDSTCGGGEPPAAQLVLQKRVDRVQAAPLASTGEDQVWRYGAQDEALIA